MKQCINELRVIAHLNLNIHRRLYYRLIAEEAGLILQEPAAKRQRST